MKGGARLPLPGLVLLAGVALGGAATGGYALGAAASKPRLPATTAPRATGAAETLQLLREIEGRLARLEVRSLATTASHAQELAGTTSASAVIRDEAKAPAPHEHETADPLSGASDPDELLSSQRIVENVLTARGVSEANKVALRETLPKLSMDDRMAAISALSDAMNRGEIEFDARRYSEPEVASFVQSLSPSSTATDTTAVLAPSTLMGVHGGATLPTRFELSSRR
jgi:hypothetical protein